MDNIGVITSERISSGYFEYDVTELAQLAHPDVILVCTNLPVGGSILKGAQSVVGFTRHLMRFFLNSPTVLQPYSLSCEDKSTGQFMWGWPHLVVKETLRIVDNKIVELRREIVERSNAVDGSAAAAQKEALLNYTQKYFGTPSDRISTNSLTPRNRTDNHREELPVVDLSFCDIKTPIDVARAIPRGAALRVPTQTVVSTIIGDAPDPKAQGSEEKGEGDNTRPNAKKVVVKAQKKDGESKAYEFEKELGDKRSNLGKALLDGGKEDNQLKAVARGKGNKFMTSAVRLNNNELEGDFQMLPTVLCTIMVDATVALTWLDLSCNKITVIPDLTIFPINILYLHQNKIENINEVRKLTKIPLTNVTLFGNPIDNVPTYKAEVLNILMPPAGTPAAKASKCDLKKFDHVILSKGDMRSLSSYRAMAVAGVRGKTSPRKLNLKGLKLPKGEIPKAAAK